MIPTAPVQRKTDNKRFYGEYKIEKSLSAAFNFTLHDVDFR